MNALRRDTDYALRAVVCLSRYYGGGPKSAREISEECRFSYPLCSKILQKLNKQNVVKSTMGLKGGFVLSKDPAEITLMDIINIFQGGIGLNKCIGGGEGCEMKDQCEISTKLECLQQYIDGYLTGITLADLIVCNSEETKDVS